MNNIEPTIISESRALEYRETLEQQTGTASVDIVSAALGCRLRVWLVNGEKVMLDSPRMVRDWLAGSHILYVADE